MKEANIQDKLFTAIRNAINEKENVASVLGDILCLGKESVYRRLRGEVRFSFDEVALISQKLGFSLDSIIEARTNEKALFALNIVDINPLSDTYLHRMKEYQSLFYRFAKLSDLVFKSAFDSLPFIFVLRYENLSKFRIFKWLYQVKKIHPLPFKDFSLDKEVFYAHRAMLTEVHKIKKTEIIISQDIFASFIREVNYFFDLNLLDAEDVRLLKSELSELLLEMENLAISGSYNGTDSETSMYLCNIDVDATYFLIEHDKYYCSHLSLYEINGVSSHDPNVYHTHSQWIESLKRYSTLITNGGEIQRHKFFQEQKKIINAFQK